MAADQNFESKVESLFKGMDGFIQSKTVVGDAITVGDTIILPLVDVSFGMAAGALEGKDNNKVKNNGGGGMGAKMTPSAVLVISNGTSKLVNVRNQDGLTKVLDMVPDLVNRFTSGDLGFGSKEKKAEDASEKKTAESSDNFEE
ncbi:MAG: GerW family sporulation protein [Eubacteriales bacterium]|nr:GerW family sporulation protein [Eubacteriales bacterium]